MQFPVLASRCQQMLFLLWPLEKTTFLLEFLRNVCSSDHILSQEKNSWIFLSFHYCSGKTLEFWGLKCLVSTLVGGISKLLAFLFSRHILSVWQGPEVKTATKLMKFLAWNEVLKLPESLLVQRFWYCFTEHQIVEISFREVLWIWGAYL